MEIVDERSTKEKKAFFMKLDYGTKFEWFNDIYIKINSRDTWNLTNDNEGPGFERERKVTPLKAKLVIY